MSSYSYLLNFYFVLSHQHLNLTHICVLYMHMKTICLTFHDIVQCALTMLTCYVVDASFVGVGHHSVHGQVPAVDDLHVV